MQTDTNSLDEGIKTPCDLWVLPAPRQSHWFRRLDWYLNWQMCKGLAYSGLHLPSEIYRVAEEHAQPLPRRTSGHKGETPLLVAADGRLPTRMCLVCPLASSLSEWLANVAEQLNGLKVERVRVFLPEGAKAGEAAKIWKSKSNHKVEFTMDLPPESQE